jgi:hypothetical protein
VENMDEIKLKSENIDGKSVKSIVNAPVRIRKYIKSSELFLQYDKEITSNESILNIPLLSIVLPLAWLTDTNIRVETLDKRYHESMYLLKEEMNKIFPYKRFKTEIIVENLVENSVEANGTALLFSGGVDSMYSLLTNLEKKPSLVMIWGTDTHIYPEHAKHWNELELIYTSMANIMDLNFFMVRTNACKILDDRRIDHDYHEVLCSGWIRMKLLHSLELIPLVAPLSCGRFNECLLAGTIYPSFPFDIWSIGTIPSTDEKIVWADVSTKHDGFIPRMDKVKAISEYMKKNDITLKVCTKPEFNCSRCSKCYRTIISLLLYRVDPNTCGFKVTEKTFEEMRRYYEKTTFNVIEVSQFLQPMQALVFEKNESIIPGSAEFLEWFKNLDLKDKTTDTWTLRKVYNELPYPLALLYSTFLRKVGVNIHPTSYIQACTDRNVNRQYRISI